MKKILMCLFVTVMMLLFGSPTYAAEYSIDSGMVYDSSYGDNRRITILDTAENVYPFLVLPSDSIEKLGNGTMCTIGYVVLEDGEISKYGINNNFASGRLVSSSFEILDSKGESTYSGEFQTASLFLGSGLTTSMPVFAYMEIGTGTISDATKEILNEYYVNGNRSVALYSPPIEYPSLGEQEENDSLGYLYDVRGYDTHYWKTLGRTEQQTGSKELNDKYGDGYLVTWNCYNVSGTAIEPGTTGPASQEDTLNTRVQVKMDVKWTINHLIAEDETQEYKGIDVYSDFEDLPYFYTEEHHFSDEVIEECIDTYLAGKFDANKMEDAYKELQYLYFRVIYYDESSGKYQVSPRWTQLYIGEYGYGADVQEGTFDDDGNFIPDSSGKSYHLDDDGNITEGKNVPDDMLTDGDKSAMLENMPTADFSFDIDTLNGIVGSIIGVPLLIAAMFSFVPATVWTLFGLALLAVVIMRILGR